ncbi:hypothetical protein [Allomesorhizobium alhagi]|uniref:hypothetical protein n=1 Tax=Allomesorhizobium alhagi TaxID=475067 RepID=UPI00111232DA|nr:hypothetical protein [Mesorhizobium alhagi]
MSANFTRSEKHTWPHSGTWRPAIRDGFATANICCPKCKQIGSLEPADHQIAEDGSVSPSVVCDCGFHEHIRLIGWTVGDKK